MYESFHRYYCPHCHISIIATSMQALCNNLNDHNYQKHPSSVSSWRGSELVFADEYSAPDAVAIEPKRKQTWANTNGLQLPMDYYMTPEGRQKLKKWLVVW